MQKYDHIAYTMMNCIVNDCNKEVIQQSNVRVTVDDELVFVRLSAYCFRRVDELIIGDDISMSGGGGGGADDESG